MAVKRLFQILPAFLLILLVTPFTRGSDNFQYHLPPYSYHKFTNGFELILVENHTNPLIASIVIVRTGSRNETPETNGISHMLEHLTFNGTPRRTQKELYDELDFYGIYLNAQTSEDYTSYMALLHRDQIEKALDIQSDMLFHSNFPPEKFEKEKGIIAEEIRKDSESPDFKKELRLRQAFYKKPPYSMPVIGTVETVQNMRREQVVEYYRKYYSPNNMIAIVIGDFEPARMLALFKKYFGHQEPSEIPQRQITLKQKFPFMYAIPNKDDQTTYIILPAPTFHSDAYIPFNLFYEYALSAPEGLLIKELQKNKKLKIKDLRTSYEYHPEFGILTFKITTDKEVKPIAVKKALVDAMGRVLKEDLDSREIQATKRSLAINEILQEEKILYYGFLKAQELAIGGLAAFEKTVPALLQLKESQLKHFMRRYPQTWVRPEKLFAASTWYRQVDIKPYKTALKRAEKQQRKIYRHVFPNGLTVIQLRNTDNPVLALHFLFKNRSAFEPADQRGIADFFHHSLYKASKNYPEEKLKLALKEIGAEVKAYDWAFIPYDDYYNVPEYSYVRFVTLDQFFDLALKINADNLLYPDLESNFEKIKSQMSRLAAQNARNPRLVGLLQFKKMLFGKDHPLAQPVSGTPETIANITPESLKTFHRRYFTANNLILTVVSSLDSSTVFGKVAEYFGSMPTNSENVEIPPIPATTSEAVDSMLVGTSQSYLYWGYDFAGKTEDATALNLMNQMLSNDIAFNLREKQGLAYRIGSRISRWGNMFTFYAYMGTAKENLKRAVPGIQQEVEQFKTHPTDEKTLQRIKNSVMAALVRRRASRETQAYTLGINEFYGHPPADFFRVYDKIKAVTLPEIERVKQAYLRTSPAVLFYTIPSGNKNSADHGMPGMPPGMKH